MIIVLYSGKSESITITNEKGRLSQGEIDRMVADAEKFASEDEAQRKRIESLNSLSTFVYGLRTQVNDEEGMGGKISAEDKKTLLAAIKETTEWIDENGVSATAEDLEEKLAGTLFHPIMRYLTVAYDRCRGPRYRQPHYHEDVQWWRTFLR